MQLRRDREQFEAAGANLVVIGQGSPEDARRFMRNNHVEGLEMLVDPDRSTYVLAGTKVATRGELLGPSVVAKGVLTALRNRVHQGLPVGHPAQLGGVLVIAPDGSVRYAHLSEDASDNPPTAEILAAGKAIRPRVS